MANIKQVTELDFEDIKNNLKVFLSSQDKFSDYDFDASGMNILLDILSYNTQYNALLAHMNINEAFLQSAQLRQNVVSLARTLNYVPKSRKAATAQLDVTVLGDEDSPTTITMQKGQNFTGIVNNLNTTFVTNTAYTATKNSNNNYVFQNVLAYEGSIKTDSYRVDNAVENQKFVINDPKIDTSTLVVRVKENQSSTVAETYAFAANVLQAGAESKVYYIQENSLGQYELYFGDGVFGKKPVTGNIVQITFISTSGEDGNGAKSFSLNGSIDGQTGSSIALSDGFTRTNDGAEKESIESIKFNAPRAFTIQNRAVTAEDYKALLTTQYDFIEDLSVWGGETNDPPVYGKVFISIKPLGADFLSDLTKTGITSFLRTKNVGSVTTEIVNPDYTYLSMRVFFKFDNTATTETQGQLEALVLDVVRNYDATTLSKFDGVFRFSNLLSLIDQSSDGILNTTIRINMHKHFDPNPGIATKYTLKFAGGIYEEESTEPVLSSNRFTVEDGREVIVSDTNVGASEGQRIVKLIDPITGNDIPAYTNVGTVDLESGVLIFDSLTITSTNEVKIFAKPESNDIAPKFNQLVRIEFDDTDEDFDADIEGVKVTGELDTIAVLGSSAAGTYTTFGRHDN